MRFETSSLQWYWQVLDPQLLSERLLESVFYLHAQPPLFNLLLGVGLKVAGTHSAALFQLVFLVLGLAMAAVIFLMLTRFGLPPLISAVLVLVYAASPNWSMYEMWLFYDFPNAVALVLAGWCLLQYGRHRSAGWLAGFFAVLGAVVLTRSLFHLAWFVLCVGIVVLTESAAVESGGRGRGRAPGPDPAALRQESRGLRLLRLQLVVGHEPRQVNHRCVGAGRAVYLGPGGAAVAGGAGAALQPHREL